jgi:hypothetical protein
MTIEVRQMLIKSTVGAESPPAQLQGDGCGGGEGGEGGGQMREDILAECKAWVEERLRQTRER